jgi:hypothetical protein
VNRLIEPWMWITIIASATEQPNMYGLRLHKDAEPHYQHLMRMSKAALDASVPVKMPVGGWHMPLIFEEDWHEVAKNVYPQTQGGVISAKQWIFEQRSQTLGLWRDLIKISVGRCARVSYLTHEGKRDLKEDIRLHDDLLVKRPLHASPAEHVAQALDTPKWSGNFQGWLQYRKTLPHENITTWEEVEHLTGHATNNT